MGDGRPEFTCEHKDHDLSTLCLACWQDLKAENVKLKTELHESEKSHDESIRMYRSARDRADAALLQISALKQSLINCVTFVHVDAGHGGEVKTCPARVCVQATAAMGHLST